MLLERRSRHSALPPAANRRARRRGWLGGQKSLPCGRGDGKGRGDDEPVLVIKLSPAWKGFLSICRVAPGQVGGEGRALLLASPAIPPGGEIPSQYTCDGADISPRLTWSGVPNESRALSSSSRTRMRPPGYPAVGLFSTFPAVHTVATPVIPQTGQPRV